MSTTQSAAATQPKRPVASGKIKNKGSRTTAKPTGRTRIGGSRPTAVLPAVSGVMAIAAACGYLTEAVIHG